MARYKIVIDIEIGTRPPTKVKDEIWDLLNLYFTGKSEGNSMLRLHSLKQLLAQAKSPKAIINNLDK